MTDPASVPPSVETFFAPATRSAPGRLRREVELCRRSPLTAFLLGAVQGQVAILNEHRQILAASPDLLGALGPRWDAQVTGARPGEAFECIHVGEGPGGCGTSPACAHCGMLISLLTALKEDGPQEGECRLTMRRHGRWEASDYHVTASRLQVSGHRFLTLVFRDIGAQKRRETLERLFFHDIANILQGLHGWSEGLAEGAVRAEDAAHRILHISERLSQEVHSHRRLLQAERNTLSVHPSVLQGGLVLQEVVNLLERHPAGGGRRIERLPVPAPASFVSDPDLLVRVVYNMALNALEATGREAPVRLSFGWRGDHPRFAVHNPGVIPEAVRHQIFHRSFSTKAPSGRGLGTYAMKLFGENFLRGQVGFDSSQDAGTTFWIHLPPRLLER